MTPGTGIDLRLVRARPCVARVRWWSADGRLAGDKRVHDTTTLLRVPPGSWRVEVEDARSSHDPARLAPGRAQVEVRAGWRTAAEVRLAPGATAGLEQMDLSESVASAEAWGRRRRFGYGNAYSSSV